MYHMKRLEHITHIFNILTLHSGFSHNIHTQAVSSVNSEEEYGMQMVIRLTSDSTKTSNRISCTALK